MANVGGIRAGRAYVELYADASKLQRSLKAAESRLKSFGDSASSIGAQFMGLGVAASLPIAAAVRGFAAFDDQMRAVQAVSGSTAEEFAMLTERAKELGRTTSFTAAEVANTMAELGRAGFKAPQIDAAIGSVMNLSRATQTEIPLATEIAGNALRAFNLDASEMGRVCDVMTATAAKSAGIATDAESAQVMRLKAEITTRETELRDANARAVRAESAAKKAAQEIALREATARAIQADAAAQTGGIATAREAAKIRSLEAQRATQELALRAASTKARLAESAAERAQAAVKSAVASKADAATVKALKAEASKRAAVAQTALQAAQAEAAEARAKLATADASANAARAELADANATLANANSKARGAASARAFAGALRGVVASIGPLLAFSAVTAVGASFANASQRAAEKAREASDAAAETARANQEQRDSYKALFERLEELNEKSALTNAEFVEAKGIIAQLTGAYGDLGFTLDETAKKFGGLAEAQEAFNKKQREQRKADLASEDAALNAELEQLAKRHDNLIGDWTVGGVWAGVKDALGMQGGTEEQIVEINNREAEIRRKLAANKLEAEGLKIQEDSAEAAKEEARRAKRKAEPRPKRKTPKTSRRRSKKRGKPPQVSRPTRFPSSTRNGRRSRKNTPITSRRRTRF